MAQNGTVSAALDGWGSSRHRDRIRARRCLLSGCAVRPRRGRRVRDQPWMHRRPGSSVPGAGNATGLAGRGCGGRWGCPSAMGNAVADRPGVVLW